MFLLAPQRKNTAVQGISLHAIRETDSLPKNGFIWKSKSNCIRSQFPSFVHFESAVEIALRSYSRPVFPAPIAQTKHDPSEMLSTLLEDKRRASTSMHSSPYMVWWLILTLKLVFRSRIKSNRVVERIVFVTYCCTCSRHDPHHWTLLRLHSASKQTFVVRQSNVVLETGQQGCIGKVVSFHRQSVLDTWVLFVHRTYFDHHDSFERCVSRPFRSERHVGKKSSENAESWRSSRWSCPNDFCREM